MLVYDLNSGKFLVNENTSRFQAPASTLKLFVALAAKLYLPNDFTYGTDLELSGDDIILRFKGDPTLTKQQIFRLLSYLREKHITTIDGDFIIDGSAFNGVERGIGVPWDTIGVCYNMPSSAVTVDGNCFEAQILTTKPKSKPLLSVFQDPEIRAELVRLPETIYWGTTNLTIDPKLPVQMSNTVVSLSKEDQQLQRCDFILQTQPNNQYRLGGCLAYQSEPYKLKFAIQNTQQYTKNLVLEQLKILKIKLNGQVKFIDSTYQKIPSGVLLAKHSSASIGSLIETMLKQSDNLIANNLIKTLGQYDSLQPGNFTNGAIAVVKILKERAQIDLGSLNIVDGSGLSPQNRITANQLMQILRYIYENDTSLELIKALPVAGVDGTLKKNTAMQSEALKTHLIAKTGAIEGISNMAGFLYSPKNKTSKPLIFVQPISHYQLHFSEPLIYDELPSVQKFQNHFYNDLSKQYLQ
jgi:D-alanyl-D-alanine carboxypeptidase/D-alanyl-D-alanine-endopeptidase (penicillin-binding protein 4)